MKRLLSILGAITLVGTSTTSLVACNKSNEYTAEQLKELKEKNKIDTKNKEIRDNLEWMASQEKPFNNIDNKYYYVVWRGKNEDNWRIIKFKYDNYEENKALDNYGNYEIQLFKTGISGQGSWKDIGLVSKNDVSRYFAWSLYKNYFKYIYRWNLTTQEPDLIVDNDGIVKVKGE